jgi:phosphoserine phosphatase
LKGLPEATIARCSPSASRRCRAGATLVATMKAHGAYAALVSGGFVSFVP